MKFLRLKVVCVIGFALALLIVWGMIFFGLIWQEDDTGTGSFSGTTDTIDTSGASNAFIRDLRAYDRFDALSWLRMGNNPAQVERRLSRLQRRARSVEEYLSVLKRWRAAAALDVSFVSAYREAAHGAAEAFPHSAPLALTAAEAMLLDNSASAIDPSLLSTYASRLSQHRFRLPELALHTIAGNLESPDRAAALPALENLLVYDFASIGTAGINEQMRISLTVNAFLLKAARGDISGAFSILNPLLAIPAPEVSDDTSDEETLYATILDTEIKRIAAEFFYDHNYPIRAAEFFFQLGGEVDLARAADALTLAGEISGARTIWTVLLSPLSSAYPRNGEDADVRERRYRQIYNMAATAATQQEALQWLERLFSYHAFDHETEDSGQLDNLRIYGIIRYTRLLDTERSIEVLSEAAAPDAFANNNTASRQHPLLQVELMRRLLETWQPSRTSAEVWLALNRGEGEEALYEWAAWYFQHNRQYREIDQVLRNALNAGMQGEWLYLHRALQRMREGSIDEALELLMQAGNNTKLWRVYANLARIHESRGETLAALQAYEAAASLVLPKTPAERNSAALLHLELSRNLQTMGRSEESRRVLLRAESFEPDDFSIRRQLQRLIER